MKNILIGTFLTFSVMLAAQKNITVDLTQPVFEVQPTMWGIFFEDINFAGDGGIYAELVKNRSFEFLEPMMGWRTNRQRGQSGNQFILNRDEDAQNPRYIRLVNNSDNVPYGIYNEGFRGMGIKEGLEYRFSVMARNPEDNPVELVLELTNENGEIIGTTSLSGFTNDWEKYNTSFTTTGGSAKATLKVLVKKQGTVDLDMISLFPSDTYNGRENGMRADIMQILADMQPKFVRFPGGCVVEGHHLELRYQWKKTVGPTEDRELIINRWNTEFSYRLTPDYFQSFGLGFYEYFLISEDLGAEPLPILNCGMACQYNTGELVPLEDMDPYIQDAIDLIEFANGKTNTKWGKLRADMGHPEPFNLKYIGIGNEQWGEQYVERYNIIAEKIREIYPDIQLVSGSGPRPNDDRFEYLWSKLPEMEVDLVDEHYYMSPEWFMSNADRYDSYDRKGPKVFAGEYAAHGPERNDPSSRNTWLSAMAEAAYLTGLERNADVVHMTSYAPLLAHVDAWQWRPDLIWFDNLNVFGTPNYYVQKLYATHSGTHVVDITMNGKPLIGQDNLYASTTIDKDKKEAYIKLINTSLFPVDVNLNISGKKGNKIKVLEMTANDLLDYNNMANPTRVSPVEKEISVSGKSVNYSLPKQSFTLLVVKM